jgi:hypothetical protein
LKIECQDSTNHHRRQVNIVEDDHCSFSSKLQRCGTKQWGAGVKKLSPSIAAPCERQLV